MRAPFAKVSAFTVLHDDQPIDLSVNDQKERKRTMKKRIVALLLVLVLTMAMMVPAFAAAPNPCPNGHNSYTPYSYGTEYYVSNGNKTHRKVQIVSYICTQCAHSRDVEEVLDASLPCNAGVTNKCHYCGYTFGRNLETTSW